MPWLHTGGGPPLRPIYTLIDARDGNRTDEVTGFCKSVNNPVGPWVLPCMGGRPNALKGKPYTKAQLDAAGKMTHLSRRRGLVGFEVITVGTNYYQSWIHNCLDRRDCEDTDSLVFPATARYDQDLFDQLMAERPDWKITTTGHSRAWLRGMTVFTCCQRWCPCRPYRGWDCWRWPRSRGWHPWLFPSAPSGAPDANTTSVPSLHPCQG